VTSGRTGAAAATVSRPYHAERSDRRLPSAVAPSKAREVAQVKKTRTCVVAGAALSILLAGCSGGGGGQGGEPSAGTDLSQVTYEGTVSVLTRYAGDYEAYFQKMKADYETAHPGVTIDLQQESDQGYKDKIKTLTASQSLPDVYFSWAGAYAAQFQDNGLALDLTSVIAPGTQWGDTFAKSALEVYDDDGVYFGIPFGLDAKFMVYNDKLMAQAGVDVPTDFDGLITACQALKGQGITPMAFGNIDGWPAIHYITQLNSYDVPAATLTADFDPATATWDDPGYVESIDQFGQILSECTTTGQDANGSDYYSERDAFSRGEAAMFYVENLEFGATAPEGSQVDQDGWSVSVLPVPAGAKGDTGSLTGAPDAFLVNPKAKNLALAVDFMKFVTSTDNAAYLTKTTGIPSPVTGSLTEDNSTAQLRDSLDTLAKASSMSIWLDTVTVPDVADAWLSGIEGFVSGSKTADDVVAGVKAASEAAKG
jgi:raffinose/stachyose/melibiose transport system substrate-binding protein